ncbi:acyl-CoA dehydrogenase family protein [Klugiella xanthotipulae]|uniref:Alkylation response protein AidB-like acyl-CoA dehydrogenase n=1 Tax=Klugiella xanthotipulae TaxID=244735 RepID=A0A543I496_9MICO|nr:acyl-CoA dehydrogenase family protein [Klugiella xanthotipulae]TQM65413.1 alkylation response protein AidB-like acyl-CoA dehydrogenase [Klugiella xanthotipulae]
MQTILSDELLERIRHRAAGYDARNEFFTEDLEELAQVGYLGLFSPEKLGGLNLGLEEVAQLQMRLAAAAPATALGINMHLVWTGVARAFSDRGDTSLDWLLAEAAAGEIFAFGISEAGNDSVLFDSDTVATPTPGGYRFTGTKIFTSLSPAWTRLGIFGRDNSDPENPKLVYGFITRETSGYTISDDWNPLGMRATQSRSTVLDNVFVPADRIIRILPVGPSADLLPFAIFANFELLLASVYAGLGDRALRLAVETVTTRRSKKTGEVYANDPNIRWRIASAAIEQAAVRPQILASARDVDALADHGPAWFPLFVGPKIRATETARRVVDAAIRVSGGGSYRNDAELTRLYRDVVAGLFHPSDDESAHGTFADAYLGPITS